MAKYNIVSTSKFNPFTYEELVRPLQEATQTHVAIEDQLSDYSSKVSMLGSMINPETEQESYTKYQNYINNVNSQTEALNREGLNKVNRQGLQKAKNEYMQNIIPIEQAFTRRRQLAEEQRRLKISDPTLFIDNDASLIKLDDLVNNPELSYNALSGASIEKQASTLASNLTRQLRSNPDKWDKILETTIGDKSAAQYYRNKQQQGYTINEILSLDDKALTTIIDQVLQGTPFYRNADPITKEEIEIFAKRGIWSALGTTKNETLTNRAFEEQLKPDKDTLPELPPEHHFREVSTTFTDTSENTEKLKNNIDFIKNLIENPNLMDKEETVSLPTYFASGATVRKEHTFKPNEDKIFDILQNAGIDTTSLVRKDGKFTKETEEILSNIINKLNSDIDKSAYRSTFYSLNVVDSANLNDILLQNASIQHQQNSKSIAFTHIKSNGNRGNGATPEEVRPFLNKNTAFVYNPIKKRFEITGYNDGERKTFMVDPETISSKTVTLTDENGKKIIKNSLQHAMDIIDDRIKKEDYEGAKKLRTAMLNDIYYSSQSRSKVQSNTNSQL